MRSKFGVLQPSRGFRCYRCGFQGTKEDERVMDNAQHVVLCIPCAKTAGYTPPIDAPLTDNGLVTEVLNEVLVALKEVTERVNLLENEVKTLKEKKSWLTQTKT